MASDRHEFTRLATRADFTFSKYRRHFSGKSRASRDPALLTEMIADLRRIEADMVAHLARNKVPRGEEDLGLVRSSLELYERELGEVGKAQSGQTPEQEADILSSAANQQFEVYRTHFAKAARASRRPQQLERVIGRLRQVLDRMVKLRSSGYDADFHTKNIGIVEENIARYVRELGEVNRVREGHGTKGLIPHLGDAANALFAEYREGYAGKPRNSVDADRLVVLCDKLEEIRRQMDDIGATVDDERNEKNYHIVVGQLRMFEKEWTAIQEAKKK
jgi:hypothetical protein